MATDSSSLRNKIFGKVAHLVVGDRGLVKPEDRPTVDNEFRLLTNVSRVVNQQMMSNRISDSMVLEVFVNNKQASPGEMQEILLERWQLTWHRMGRTGVQAWTGLHDNNIDKTLVAMLRRVALSARLTQTMHLLKKAISSQYEIEYRILQSASTLHFGATDDRQTVIFHGHEGHLWWHINNHTSFSFTMAFRSNPWTPRSLPTHISPMAIINDYNPNAASSSPSTGAITGTSPAAQVPISSSAPRYQPQTSQSPVHMFHQQQHQPPPHSAHLPPVRSGVSDLGHHVRPAFPLDGDDYAANPLPHPVRSPSGLIHEAYFRPSEKGNERERPGEGPFAAISTSLPKTSPPHGMGLPLHHSPGNAGTTGAYVTPAGLPGEGLSPRGGSMGTGFVSFGGPSHAPHAPYAPNSASSGGHPNPFAHAMGTSPKYPSQLGSVLGNSPDRVPGSSPPASSDRPVRTRSASNSASQILSSASTSISPYRVDLTSTMAKSPPSHQVGLPLDMIGPGTGPARPPSSGKLPISFGASPTSQPQLPTSHAPASGHATYSTTQPYLVGSPITTSLSKGSLPSHLQNPNYLHSSTTSSSEAHSPEPQDPIASGYSAMADSTRGDVPMQANEWLTSLSQVVLPPVVHSELSSLAYSPLLSHELPPHDELSKLFDAISHYTLPHRAGRQ